MTDEILDWYKTMGFRFWKIENQNGKPIAAVPVEKDGKGDPEGEKLYKELSRLERLNSTGTYNVGGSERNGKEYSYQSFVIGNPSQPQGFQPRQTNTTLYGLEMATELGRMQSEMAVQPLKLALEQKEKELRELKAKKPENEGFGLGVLIQEAVKQVAPEVIKQVLPNLIKGAFDLANTSTVFRNLLERVASEEVVQTGILEVTKTYFSKQQNDGITE